MEKNKSTYNVYAKYLEHLTTYATEYVNTWVSTYNFVTSYDLKKRHDSDWKFSFMRTLFSIDPKSILVIKE